MSSVRPGLEQVVRWVVAVSEFFERMNRFEVREAGRRQNFFEALFSDDNRAPLPSATGATSDFVTPACATLGQC